LPKKNQKNAKRAEEKKKNVQPVVTTLVSTRTGTDEKGTLISAPSIQMGALVGLGFIPERDFLDGGLVGELFPQTLLPHSALYQAYKVIPFPSKLSLPLSLSLMLRVCGILSTHPLFNNKLSLLAAN
jgi:hypothetical protein